ncbi:MAG: hypothetical protein KME20_27530 [Kaiparowitsia implicata GSE-PSE-MK54-09C]|nr:hypothetical protein [Kaiparowitsia implicata GSE-PSE-MK54-09C]
MFFPSDPFSEIVVHFVGYFQIAVEDTKARLQLEQVDHDAEPAPDAPLMREVAVDMEQSHTMGAYMPGVYYAPPEFWIRGEAQFGPVRTDLHEPSSFDTPSIDRAWNLTSTDPADLPSPLIGQEPGSVIAVLTQMLSLSDSDVFVMGILEQPLLYQSGADIALSGMQAAAGALLGPIGDGLGITSHGDVPVLVETTLSVAEALRPNPDMRGDDVETLTGIHVNGLASDEVPDLEEALPQHRREGSASDNDPRTVEVKGEHTAQLELQGADIEGTITYKSGGNFLMNEATVLNAGLTGTHFVVGGDFHQLDAIIQINAYRDHDCVSSDFPLAANLSAGGTAAFNIASFVQETHDAAGEAALAKPGSMAINWQITVVHGDIIFLEWMKQLTFVSDQDIGVLTAAGSDVLVTSGENIGFNSISLLNLGLHYDLIMVGGTVYDANVIVQKNILYDNDTITMLGTDEGEAFSAPGSLTTSGNLLWNQASIHNVGATDVEQGISDYYGTAMDGLAQGSLSMPSGFRAAEEFEGIAIPRVLYVSGSIYDLRYVEQTNVLGDADLVALQKSAFHDGQAESEWQVDTGSNALVNIASIKDYDTFGDSIEVGGNHYSDAILIQAEILAANGDEDPEALVTEVVAFVAHTENLADTPDLATGDMINDAAPVDLMQSMLA